jgi:putative flippase GtrA
VDSGHALAQIMAASSSSISWLFSHQRTASLFVGFLNTVIGFALFTGLELTIGEAVGYLVVLLLSHVTSVLCAFVLYRRLVFNVRGDVLGGLVRFELVYLTSILVNLALLPILVEIVNLPVLLAQGLIVFVGAAISFFGHRHVSFRRSLFSSTCREGAARVRLARFAPATTDPPPAIRGGAGLGVHPRIQQRTVRRDDD